MEKAKARGSREESVSCSSSLGPWSMSMGEMDERAVKDEVAYMDDGRVGFRSERAGTL